MPDWGKDIRERLASLRLDPAREASVVEEIAQHLDDRVAELTAGGVSPEAARQSVLDELAGGPALAAALAESLPRPTPSRLPPADEGDGAGWLSGLARDFRYGSGACASSPFFSLVAVLSLALGIGANTAIFQLLDAVRLRSLPVARAAASSTTSGSRPRGRAARGNFSGRWPAADVGAVGPHPQRAEGLLEARGLELGPRQPGLRRRGALRRGALGQRDVLRHRGRRAPARPGPGPRRRHARLPVAGRVLSERFWQRELGGRDFAPGETHHGRGHTASRSPASRPRASSASRSAASFDVALPVCAEDLIADSPRTKRRSRLVARRDRPPRPRMDAREGERAPRRDLEGHLRIDAARGLRRRPTRSTFSASSCRRRPAATGFSDLRDRLFRSALAAARHLGARPAHRLRQHRQPDGRPGERAAAGDRRAAGPRRLRRGGSSGSSSPRASSSRPPARPAARRSRRPSRRLLVTFLSAPGTRRGSSTMPLDLRLLAFTAGARGPDLRALRPAPRRAGLAHGSDRGDEDGRPRHRGCRRAALGPPGARRLAGRAVARAPRRLAALRPEPAQPPDARRRLHARPHPRRARGLHAAARAARAPRSSSARELLERVRALPGVTGAANARIVPLGGDGWNEHSQR